MLDYNELFSKSKEIAKETGLTQLEIYQRFMFERILERISFSKYNNNFILKGGLLLSAMLGIDSRSTRDMDISIKGITILKDEMVNILNEILSIDIKDNVNFEIVDVTDIRENDEYGGNKYHIVGKLENLKVALEIDISTGDEITPRELKYEYPSLFEDKKIFIDTYNIETILAEKIETILRRGKYNARMKDYYDVYFFLTKLKSEINLLIFKKAINNTLDNRDSFSYYNDYEQILDGIIIYNRINANWNTYKRKNKYADNIEFKDIIEILKEFIKEVNQIQELLGIK
ncbi:MAG: nucleotidyl transferase AbiEii/AbiGii toxin family protein [Clostridia bacterium]|nr:nucleotidyl transferase AbiEii/AbiGii toxin family protein [Clostridia bacterium]